VLWSRDSKCLVQRRWRQCRVLSTSDVVVRSIDQRKTAKLSAGPWNWRWYRHPAPLVDTVPINSSKASDSCSALVEFFLVA
jgi:hypothetical protein